MIRFNCVVIAIALISCEREPDISGHWVSVPYDDNGGYQTIDIIDSLLIADRGSLSQTYGDTFMLSEIYLDSLPYFEGKEGLTKLFDIYWPDDDAPKWDYDTISNVFGDTIAANRDDEMTADLNIAFADITEPYINILSYVVALRNDTLIVDAEHTLGGGYFIRGEPQFEPDLFADRNVVIELVRYKGTNCEHKSNSNVAWISIGKSRSPMFGDSSKIQVSDVFIDVPGVPQFLEVEKLKFEISEREKLAVALAIDRNTQVEFVKVVVETIREYDRDMELTFPVINRREEKVCFLDSAGFFQLFNNQKQ